MNLKDSTVLIASGLLTNLAQEFVVVVVCDDEAIKHSWPKGSFSQTSILFLARSNLEVGKNWTCYRTLKFVLPLSRCDLKHKKMELADSGQFPNTKVRPAVHRKSLPAEQPSRREVPK